MMLTISLKVKADFVCLFFFCLNEFGVIYCRCYAECLLWFCGGFFFSKGEFLEPRVPVDDFDFYMTLL